MSVSKTLYTTTRNIPQRDETGWGAEVTTDLEDLVDHAEDTSCKVGTEIVAKEPQTTTVPTAGYTLAATHRRHLLNPASAVSLDATTAIAAGTITGQLLTLVGASDTNTVTILNGANTVMNGSIILGLNEEITFRWDGADWVEKGRTS